MKTIFDLGTKLRLVADFTPRGYQLGSLTFSQDAQVRFPVPESFLHKDTSTTVLGTNMVDLWF
jgi:hypothetical protein